MIDLKPKVLDFIQRNGPSLPLQVAKDIKKDSFFASAILSELLNSKKIKLSHAKIGGSSVYYFPGQEYKLGSVLYNYLNSREKEAYDLLKKNSVLEDSKLKPVERVALSELTDFAVSVHVKHKEEVTKFWKWHLLSDEEVRDKIQNILGIEESQKKLSEPIPIIKEEQKLEPEKIEEPLIKVPEQKIEEEKPIVTEEKLITPEVKEEPKPAKKIKKKKIEKKEEEFLDLVENYCAKNSIKIITKEIIKNNREVNMKVKLPTKVGDLTFFLKAKNKKKISNGDLSIAYNEAQQLGLPILFLTTGESNKKIGDFIEKNLRNQLLFKRLE